MNGSYNGRWMWDYRHMTEALGNMGPYHANSQRYLNRVGGMMDEEYQGLLSSGTLTPDTAFNALMNIISLLLTIDSLNTTIDVIG